MTRKRSTRARSNVRAISPWLEEKILERKRTARALVLENHLMHNSAPSDFPTQEELNALERTFERASGCSGGQGRVRQFLLSWHSTKHFGGFDITDLWNLDEFYGGDVRTLIAMIARGPGGFYPAHYGYEKEIEALTRQYRPGEYTTERCHKCDGDVGHICDEAGYQRSKREQQLEREREELERDRQWREEDRCNCDALGGRHLLGCPRRHSEQA